MLQELTTAYFTLVGTSFFFLFEQIILLALIYKDKAGWKIRFVRVRGHPNLTPVQKTIKITAIVFVISLFLMPLLGLAFSDSIVNYVENLQWGFIALLSLLAGAFFFIWHYLVEKKWNKIQVCLVILQAVLIMLLIILNAPQ